VASVPLDNWRQHSELLLFYHYVIDNQGFIILFFDFASVASVPLATDAKSKLNTIEGDKCFIKDY